MKEIYSKLNNLSILRCLNFCEIEFGEYGVYGFNNINDIKETLITDFECSATEIIELLLYNADMKKTDDFFYTNGRKIISLSKDDIEHCFIQEVLPNMCNGELKEIIKEEMEA